MYTRGLSKAVNMNFSDSNPSDWRDTKPFRNLSFRFSHREQENKTTINHSKWLEYFPK